MVDLSSSGVLAPTLFSLAHSMISSLLESVALSLLACVPAAVFSLSRCTLMCLGSQRPAARRPGPAAGEELLQVPKDAANGGEVANDGCCAGSACQHRFVMATRYLGVENRNKAATRQRGRSCLSCLPASGCPRMGPCPRQQLEADHHEAVHVHLLHVRVAALLENTRTRCSCRRRHRLRCH